MEGCNECIIDHLLVQQGLGGGTNYTTNLHVVETTLMKGAQHHNVKVKKPSICFLSNGESPVHFGEKITKNEPRLILHTTMFGGNVTKNILMNLICQAIEDSRKKSIFLVD